MAITKLDYPEPPIGPDRPGWLDPIAHALRQLRYGSVEITVHDGRIVQIERKEKLRFETPPSTKGT